MERKEIKRIIDTELNEIVFTDIMKKKVFENSKRRIFIRCCDMQL